MTLGPFRSFIPVSKCKKWWKDGLCRLFQGTKRDWAVQASTGLLVSNSLANRGRSVKVCVWCSWRFQKKRAEVFWFLCWAIFHRPDVWVWVPLSNHVDSVLEWMFLRGNIPNMSILYWTTLDYAAKPRPNKKHTQTIELFSLHIRYFGMHSPMPVASKKAIPHQESISKQPCKQGRTRVWLLCLSRESEKTLGVWMNLTFGRNQFLRKTSYFWRLTMQNRCELEIYHRSCSCILSDWGIVIPMSTELVSCWCTCARWAPTRLQLHL